MRFMWESNAPWAGTGYGQQTRILLNALQQLGHDVSCFAFYGLSGGKIEYDGYEVYPNSDFESWGNDVIQLHIHRSNSEAVITLIDLFVLDKKIWSKLDVPWIAWVPVDSVDLGIVTREALKACDFPVAMSDFGAQEMRKVGIEPVSTIYHAVDTDTYKPMDKKEQRDILSIPEDVDFVIGMVMANKGDRKQYPLQLTAAKQFMDKNPDLNIVVYMHTEPTSAMGGWDMRQLVDQLGLKGRVYSTNQYDTSVVPMPNEFMARIYNSFDVLMNCSSGEGFGIPIVEAQACGVPVIAHDVTAMPELVANGYLVKSEGMGLGGHYGWQFLPSIEDMVYRLDCVYRMDSKDRQEVGRQWVIENCSVPVIANAWDVLLGGVQELMSQPLDKREGRLNLGAGVKPDPTAVNHDRILHDDWVDVAHDLNQLPWPWADGSLKEIQADDVMEHLEIDIPVWLNELWRVLEPGGTLSMRLPAWDNPLSYRDPTHRKVFHEESFYYWDPDTNLWQDFGRYYFEENPYWWRVTSIERESGDIRFTLVKLDET